MTKIDVPKFILGANQMAKPGQLYLTHTQEPMFIAEVIPFEGNILKINELKDKYPIAARTNAIDGTYFIINLIKISDTKIYDDLQYKADEYSKLMSRAADWCYNYLKNTKNE